MLAREMGIPASELAHRLPYSEFIDHIADYAIEPWGPVRGDLQAAQIVCTLANQHRQRGRKAFTLADCQLRFQAPDKKRRTVEEAIESYFLKYSNIQ
ncbi:MAG: phage tail assembly protein T [Planctomycetota bacterium]